MYEKARKHGTARWATHGRRDERVWEKSTALLKNGSSLWHVIERTQLYVLVVSHHENDVWLLVQGRQRRQRSRV